MSLRAVAPLATRLFASNSMRRTPKATSQSPRRRASSKDISSLVREIEVIEIRDSDEEGDFQVMKDTNIASISYKPKVWPPRRGKNRPTEPQAQAFSSANLDMSGPVKQPAPIFTRPPQKVRTSVSSHSVLPAARPKAPIIQKRSMSTPAVASAGDVPPEADLAEALVPKVLSKYTYKDYMPKACFVYTTDEAEADDLVGGLRPGPVAMDMEWRVIMRIGQLERRTALIQVADTAGVILLIQVYDMTRFPRKLVKLLENPDIPKLGANIMGDGKKLFRDYGILCKNLVELGAVAQIVDPESYKTKRKIIALARLVELYCGKELEKGEERISNWEDPLTPLQCEYAANDAHSSVIIYQRLLEIGRKKGQDVTESSTLFSSNVQMLYETPPMSRSSSLESNTSTASGTSLASNDTEITIPESVAPESTVTKATQTQMQRTASRPYVKPQYTRAYKFWHEQNMTLEKMCSALSLKGTGSVEGVRGEPLKAATVITYVIGALQSDPSLPFDMRRLRELVQMEIGSWVRHKEWILRAHQNGRGLPPVDGA